MFKRISERGRLVWRHGVRPGSSAAFLFALACVVLATLLRFALGLIDPAVTAFGTYYPAILIATLVGGAAAGAFALVVGGTIAWWAFMPPQYVFTFVSLDQPISLLIYVCSGAIILAAAESYRRLLRRFYENEHHSKLVIDELNHRVKNKIATIQAILSYELRKDKDVWNTISGRLAAISKTDDLIVNSEGRGAKIGDILTIELAPYGNAVSRAKCTGPPILLPAKLAASVALILHELTTNAAKYGALSLPDGSIEIHWEADGDRVEVWWIESGGPTVIAPTRKGFGTKLFERALSPFHGRVERLFEPGGLKCIITFSLPPDHVIPIFLDKHRPPSPPALTQQPV
jgi:two-component sensor histidine kinase